MVDNALCCYHLNHHHYPLKGLVWNDSKTKRTYLRLLKLKRLVWDFWNLNDHFKKNEKLKGPLDAFNQIIMYSSFRSYMQFCWNWLNIRWRFVQNRSTFGISGVCNLVQQCEAVKLHYDLWIRFNFVPCTNSK